ncbi:hypothetical protein Tsubulata_038920 [Turnera subulata]|uniref:BAG domain-containing protein n=1 Tax=Turnera subulata TaxID=218843 RepID=A0A9Q0GHB6_9ROSI|nr:hypothetical protein Tsubulata_038920 [Turnera subulata]
MDSRFYGIPRNYPSSRPGYYRHSPSPNLRPVPVTPVQKKVVSIPVHYVGSESPGSGPGSKADSAVKIQKVLRGFLVRKSMRKIAAIRREVDDVERKVSAEDTVELIRRDPRERLKVNELLMSLLFKLDSVRGVDSGVRDCRRAVIKKAIALQEMVDALAASGPVVDKAEVSRESLPGGENEETLETAGGDDDDSVVEACDCDSNEDAKVDDGDGEMEKDNVESVQENVEDDFVFVPNPSEGEGEGKGGLDQEGEENVEIGEEKKEKEIVSVPNPTEVEIGSEAENKVAEEDLGLVQETEVNVEAAGDEIKEKKEIDITSEIEEKKGTAVRVDDDDDDEIEGESECEESVQSESQVDSSANPWGLMAGDVDDDGDSMMDKEENVGEVQGANDDGDGGRKRGTGEDGVREESKKSRELLEKMLVDNEKMMGLMAELFERNAMQTRLLSSLSQRVEQLERAY